MRRLRHQLGQRLLPAADRVDRHGRQVHRQLVDQAPAVFGVGQVRVVVVVFSEEAALEDLARVERGLVVAAADDDLVFAGERGVLVGPPARPLIQVYSMSTSLHLLIVLEWQRFRDSPRLRRPGPVLPVRLFERIILPMIGTPEKD